jgi:ribose transport system substrate-binding protein
MAGRAVSRRAEAINQAIALQPDGIVLGTIDANEQAAVIGAAAAEGVVVVDWPCSSLPTSSSTTG